MEKGGVARRGGKKQDEHAVLKKGTTPHGRMQIRNMGLFKL